MKGSDAAPRERLIKRYENRKLYDPGARCYVTLEDLARRIGQGDDVRVVDQRTGEDLTRVVLAQVLLEGIKQRTATIPLQVLIRLIRLSSGPVAAWGKWIGPQEAAARAREEAERIVGGLLARGRLTLEEGLALRQEIARAVHDIVADAQRGLESRIHGLVERSEREGGVAPSLQTLKERLMAFETFLDEPRPKGRRAHGTGRPRRRG